MHNRPRSCIAHHWQVLFIKINETGLKELGYIFFCFKWMKCVDVCREKELLREKRRRRQELFQEQKVSVLRYYGDTTCTANQNPKYENQKV